MTDKPIWAACNQLCLLFRNWLNIKVTNLHGENCPKSNCDRHSNHEYRKKSKWNRESQKNQCPCAKDLQKNKKVGFDLYVFHSLLTKPTTKMSAVLSSLWTGKSFFELFPL